MAEEGRIAIIKAEKVSFWKQYERGMLSSDAVQILVSLADTCLDEKDRYLYQIYLIDFVYILIAFNSRHDWL